MAEYIFRDERKTGSIMKGKPSEDTIEDVHEAKKKDPKLQQ